MAKQRRELAIVGWREWVSLPELGASDVKAKIDTGARTSALHAFKLRIRERDGVDHAEFEIHPRQRSTSDAVQVSWPISSWKSVRSSNGTTQRRPVIRTDLAMGERRWPVEITLTNRDEMGFRILIGRAAIRRKFLVNPNRSYLGSPK